MARRLFFLLMPFHCVVLKSCLDFFCRGGGIVWLTFFFFLLYFFYFILPLQYCIGFAIYQNESAFMFVFLVFLFSFACTSLCCCAGTFSSCEERAALWPRCTGHCGGSPRRGALLGAGSAAVTTGLVALWYMESSPTRNPTRVPWIGRRILTHCATKEVLEVFFVMRIGFFSLLHVIK